MWSIFPDPDGGVWVGTYGGKLAYMTFADNGVDYFKATPGGLNHPIVSCFEEDTEGNLWIGTEGGGELTAGTAATAGSSITRRRAVAA